MSEINIIDDFYIPLQAQEEAYSNKKYKLLVENDIDPAELVGLKKDANSSVIKLGEEQEGQKEDLYKEVLDYAAALPKDLLISVVRGGVNGFDFIKDLAAFATYGNQELPDDSVFKFIDERIEAQKKSLDAAEANDPLTTRMIGAIGQDAAYVAPIYKKFRSMGIPKSYALPTAFALGSTFAFDKKTSFMLDTETINGFKNTINLNPDTPAEELFDKMVQFVEFSGMGFAFNKIAPIIKNLKKVDVQKTATVTAGSAGAGAAAIEVQDNIQNNIISEKPE